MQGLTAKQNIYFMSNTLLRKSVKYSDKEVGARLRSVLKSRELAECKAFGNTIPKQRIMIQGVSVLQEGYNYTTVQLGENVRMQLSRLRCIDSIDNFGGDVITDEDVEKLKLKPTTERKKAKNVSKQPKKAPENKKLKNDTEDK